MIDPLAVSHCEIGRDATVPTHTDRDMQLIVPSPVGVHVVDSAEERLDRGTIVGQ